MLKKLLKYDLKFILKDMMIFHILTLAFALIVRITSALNQTIIVVIIRSICESGLIALIINVFINTMFRCWRKFNNSLYKDEGYLTNTLPVTRTCIYESKFIATVILMFINVIVTILSLLIAYFNSDIYKSVISILSDKFTIALCAVFVVILFLDCVNYILFGYFGIIVGNRHNSKKSGMAVIYGLVAYGVSQIISLLSLVVGGIVNPKIMTIFTSSELDSFYILKYIFIIALIATVIITTLTNIVSYKFLKKGVNLE